MQIKLGRTARGSLAAAVAAALWVVWPVGANAASIFKSAPATVAAGANLSYNLQISPGALGADDGSGSDRRRHELDEREQIPEWCSSAGEQLRETGGVRLNRSLIAARGTSAGHSYSWLDRHPGRSPRYLVELVRTDGSRTTYGPVAPAKQR